MNKFELNTKFCEAIISCASQEGERERYAVPTIVIAAFIDEDENLSLQKTNTLAREHGLVVDREGNGRWHICFTKTDVERLNAHLRGEKSREEIEALKASWVKDPIWDIEFTEGFEAHIPELKAFRAEQEDKWNVEREEKVKLTFGHRAGEIMDELDGSESRVGQIENAIRSRDDLPMEAWVMAKEQVKATLLLAEQVKRVADALEDMDGRDSLAESVRIWGS